MKVTDPKVLLTTSWDKLNLKGKKETKINTPKIFYNDADDYSKTSVEFYERFLNAGKNKSEALLMSLMINYGVINVRLRGKSLSFKLENGRVVKVKLTTNDIESQGEEIIKMVIKNYVKTRSLILNGVFKNDKNISFYYNASDSGILERSDCYNISVLEERGINFGLDDNSLIMNLISELIGEFEGKINISKTCVSMPTYMDDMKYMLSSEETENLTSVVTGISFDIGKRTIEIISPPVFIVEEVSKIINEHNASIDAFSSATPKKKS